MAQQDPLEAILKVGRVLGHVSVKFDRKALKYTFSKKWLIVLNLILVATMQALYAWYVHVTFSLRIKLYGFAYSMLIILDSQLCFSGCYIMILNGLVQSKNTLKLLNIISNVRRERRRSFSSVLRMLT